MKKVLFIKNTLVLTVTSLLLRCLGIVFRVWLAGEIGAEGMGLYQVVFSVYLFSVTFASSGICTAVTRIITERLAEGDKIGADNAFKASICLSLATAAVTMGVIFLFSKPIAIYLVGDARAEQSIKILCIGIPFVGVCSCVRGYFLARRSSLPQSIGQITEQFVRIAATVVLLKKFINIDSSAAVMAGDAISEVVGTVLIYIIYKADFKKVKRGGKSEFKKRYALKEILRISLPISSGRYLHTGLRTAENLITPTCFSKYSGSKSAALEQFGMIKGMALPLLMFPASLLSSVSALLVPEMAEATAKGNKNLIKAAVDKIFYITAIISFLIGGIFFTLSAEIGNVVYSEKSVGYLIRALAPLVPFMYIDLIADGILKGLDRQKTLLRNNVADSFIRIISVIVFVPIFGMKGFLGVMLFSNLFTAILSVVKIVKVTKIKFNGSDYFFKPLTAAFMSSVTVQKLLIFLNCAEILKLFVYISLICVFYFLFLLMFGGIKNVEFLKTKSFKIGKKTKKGLNFHWKIEKN